MRSALILLVLLSAGLPASVDAVALAPSHAAAVTPVPTTIADFFLPGSQPGQSGTLEFPSKCDNCHGGYNLPVEPAFNWRGSMMAQAARDPLFYACLAIANQDAPGSGDMCIRCHSPKGWLEGRSEPTDASALTAQDREGVMCDFCHKLVRPAALGTNPFPGDADFTAGTYAQDQAYLATLGLIPGTTADGMYIADANNAKRGPFVDANATHQMFYSPLHSQADVCGTCHDVSNPAYSKSGNAYLPNAFATAAPSFDPYMLFPVERTYSEWKMSAYNQPGGVYAPQFGGNKSFVSTCQDCHMKDVSGVACNKAGGVFRTDLPLHDMTGGNTFIPRLVKDLYIGEVDTTALNSGIQRAQGMLEKAASLDVAVAWKDGAFKLLTSVTNETGHKLPSGYPEGRRIWLNVKMFDGTDALIYESGAYDPATAVLTHDPDIKVYEIKPGISADIAPVVTLPAGPSFHFAINNQIYFDNRIPPRGFRNSTFAAIQSPPIGAFYADGQHWDNTYYPIEAGAARAEVTLYYQTLSKEYVEFLRDENHTNTAGQTLYDAWAANGKSPPVAMVTKSLLIDLVTAVEEPEAGAPTLALRAALSNPGDRVAISFSLPSAAPATVELIDIQGRRILSRDVGSMGAGIHEVALDPGRRLPSGVYFVRLTQGNRFVTAKAVLTR
jgi:cytochrome c5